jgi:hypothetical protein
MNPEFECMVTASFLRSGQVLSNFSNCAAVIASFGTLLARPAAERLVFAASILCWPVACYFGVRVAIDASLFRELGRQPTDGAHALDEMLRTRGFLRVRPERTLTERSRGAFRLWIRMMIIVAVQLVVLAAAMVVQALAG